MTRDYHREWQTQKRREDALRRAQARATFERDHGHKRSGTEADCSDLWGYEARCRAHIDAVLMRASAGREALG